MEQIFISLIAGLAGGSIPVLIKYLLDKRKETLSEGQVRGSSLVSCILLK